MNAWKSILGSWWIGTTNASDVLWRRILIVLADISGNWLILDMVFRSIFYVEKFDYKYM
jgi:hypothetical protein